MSLDLEVRPFDDNDLPEVLRLLSRSLGESQTLRRTPEWFGWKHLENPFGRSLLLVAEVDHQIVGLRALMRWELVTPDGHRLRCGRPVDTATDPEFRRLGIFRTLTLSAVEEAKEAGLQLLFNTPNPRSGAGYRSMGWLEVGTVGVMVRPKIRLITRRRGQPLSGSISDAEPVRDVSSMDRAPLGLRTPRSPEYEAWRFRNNPNARYFQIRHQHGAVVARQNLRGGWLETVVSELYGHAQSALRRAARMSDSQYLVGWFSPGSPERKTAIGCGLLPVPAVRALTLMARPLDDLPCNVREFSNWDLALGDLELL